MKKRVISILSVMILAIAVLFYVETQFTSNTENKEAQSEDVNNGTLENSNHEEEKKSKQLDDKYFANMNEQINIKTTVKEESGEYSVEVTDAVLTKDISAYASKLDSPYFYTKQLEQYVNDAGVYGEGAYYMVVTIEIGNPNEGIRDILVPGDFWMQYFNSNTVEGNVSNREYDEFTRGVVIDGMNASAKGHVQLNKGDHCTAVLIASITDEKREKLQKEEKSMYLTMGSSYIQYIPNDDNRVKFVKLDFRYEG